MQMLHFVPENGAPLTLDEVSNESPSTRWEVLSANNVVLGYVELNANRTFCVTGGGDGEVELDEVPEPRLTWGVCQLYYAAYGVPLPSEDHVGVAIADDEWSRRQVVLVKKSGPVDPYDPVHDVIGFVDIDEDTGMWLAGLCQTPVTRGHESPYEAAAALYHATR